jgi:CheY-like chemotaxis protein
VTLLLPRSHHAPQGERSPAPESGIAVDVGTDRKEILLVEDDREVAALTREMLSGIGFDVIHVTSAAAALGAVANGRSIDIVLSDVMMPGGTSGLELAHELKRRRPDLPVILTTGYAEAAAGIERDGFGLLLKPYRIEALAATLNAHLGARAAAEKPAHAGTAAPQVVADAASQCQHSRRIP